jgi:hypothetical protein
MFFMMGREPIRGWFCRFWQEKYSRRVIILRTSNRTSNATSKQKLFVSFALLLLLVAAITGCTLDGIRKFAPPFWVRGTWTSTVDPENSLDLITWQIAPDNVILTLGEHLIYDFGDDSYQITETERTTDTYEFTATNADGTQTYKFAKIDDTSLNYTIYTPDSGGAGVTVVLHKQVE